MAIESVTDDWEGWSGEVAINQTTLRAEGTFDRPMDVKFTAGDTSFKPISALYADELPKPWDIIPGFPWTYVIGYSSIRMTGPLSVKVSVRYKIWEDPLAIPPKKRWYYARNSDVLEAGCVPGHPALIQPIKNSAGESPDPPMMTDYHDLVLQISVNRANFDHNLASKYMGAVNDDIWYGFPAGKVKCVLFTGDEDRAGPLTFWKHSYEFQIRTFVSDPMNIGWLRRFRDEGFHEMVLNDQNHLVPRAFGEYLIEYDEVTGAEIKRNFKPVSRPVNLDLAGRRLAEGQPDKFIEVQDLTNSPQCFGIGVKMATKRFIGGLAAVAQVDTLTPGGTIEAGDLFKITLTDERGDTYTLSVAATGTTVAQTCQDIITAFNACGDPRFAKITAAGVGSVGSYTAVTLTADTAGEPFYCSVETTEAGGGAADDQTFSRTATTASSGPYDINLTGNWLGGVLPVDSDTVYIDNIVKYGLAQSSIQPAYLKITKQVGQYPSAGMLGAYLALGAAIVDIDVSTGPVLIDTGTDASVITVFNTPAASYTSTPVVWIKANNNATTITVRKGVVGVGFGDGETTTINKLDELYVSQKSSDSTVYVGDGVTFSGTTPKVNHKGGSLSLRSAATLAEVNSDDGNLTTEGTFAITALNIKRSNVVANSSGTVTTTNITSTGTLNTLLSNTPREFTAVNQSPGSTFKRNSVVTVGTLAFTESVVIAAQAV